MTDGLNIERAPFGGLRYGSRYGAEYWEGDIVLPGVGTFAIIVRAGREGPSRAQVAAMRRLVRDIGEIRRLAASPMADLHRECGLTLPDGGRDESVWSILQAEQIDMADEGYHRDGRIFAALIFGSTVEPDFAPAIETADGVFQQVLSGT